MSTVLAVDTAGPVIGVALWRDGDVVQRSERVRRGSETRLPVWCRELAEEADVRLDALDAVAVAQGPGAFTGLRVGLSLALGVAHAAGCPVVPVCSLTTRARASGAERVLSMLDARKGRVYALWSTDGGHHATSGPDDVTPETALSWVQGPFVATGEGAIVYADRVGDHGGLVHDDAATAAVAMLARMGADALAAGEGVSPADVQPVYLRRPDARTIAERAAAKAAKGVTG